MMIDYLKSRPLGESVFTLACFAAGLGLALYGAFLIHPGLFLLVVGYGILVATLESLNEGVREFALSSLKAQLLQSAKLARITPKSDDSEPPVLH